MVNREESGIGIEGGGVEGGGVEVGGVEGVEPCGAMEDSC